MSNSVCPSCGGAVDAGTGVCPRCATQALPSVERPAPFPDIPGYQIHGQLGEGGMGAVYLAEETALGRRVAIKVISRRVASDAQSKARFLREARTLATIEHPHVVRVYSFGEVDGQPYLVMEYVEGETLADRMNRMGRLGLDEAIRITRDIVDALDAAWEHKVVHRDIKPSNILIDRRGRVRVADFGLAKPIAFDEKEISLTLSGYMVGTPHYVSPEQAQGQDADFRSDFYSVGVLLYHMLTGERPFDGATPFAIVAKHMSSPMPSLRSRRNDVPPQVDRLAHALSQKNRDERPTSHAQVLAALDAMIVRTPSAPMPSYSTIAIAPPKPWMRIAAAAALVLTIGAAIAFLVWNLRPPAPVAKQETPSADPRFVVAVTPFYGPDDDSAKEGRLMAAMIERAILQRLGSANASVLGIEETKSPVRNDEAARELGTRLAADAVIWGEAFALRTETEIQPHVTIISAAKPAAATSAGDAADRRLLAAKNVDPLLAIEGGGQPTLKLQAEAPNQIELRKTSASGMGDLIIVLAGIHALENEKDPKKALGFFEQTPESPETLQYRVQALLELDDRERALPLLERAVALDPSNAQSQALLGDLYLSAERVTDAVSAYAKAAAIGKPYTTTRGILHEGRLYRGETYVNASEPKQLKQTLYLLGVDPATQRVVERHCLPGMPSSFRTESGSLVITHRMIGHGEGPDEGELRLRERRFDKPLWPSPNLLSRMVSLKAGWALASNFLDQKPMVMREPPVRLTLRTDPYFRADRPATLPDLEKRLREAAERDPTQPWHLFFLATALREQGRGDEAKAVIAELTRREYPGVPYYELTWMLNFATRMRAYEWDAPLWTKIAAQRRRVAQPPGFGTLIERLISSSFVRIAAKIPDRERGYVALQRARELGLAPEGEDLAAAVWVKHFEKTGDARAKQERDLYRRVQEHPFNFLASNVRIDYALTAAAAAAFAFICLLLLVVGSAHARSRRIADWPARPSRLRVWKVRLLAMPRLALVAGGALLVGLIGLKTAWLFAAGEADAVFIVFAAIALPLLIGRLLRVSPRRLIATITVAERRALLAAWVVLLVAQFALIDQSLSAAALWRIPIGLFDGLGHPRVVAEFDELLTERGDGQDVLRYAAAVVNHYAGNKDRAAALYASLPASYSGAAKNRQALDSGQMPAVPLTAEELHRAWAGTRFQRWLSLLDVKEMPQPAGPLIIGAGTIGVGLVLLLLVWIGSSPVATDELPLTRFAKVESLIVPGVYDVRRGHPWRAWVMLLLAGALLVPIAAFIKVGTSVPAVGPFSAIALPNLEGTFPLPDMNMTEDVRLTMTLAYPHARLFFAILAAAAIAAIALHLSRVPRILRERVESKKDETVVVPPALEQQS